MNIVITNNKFEKIIKEKNDKKNYTLLLVDDELANIKSLTMLLEKEYNVIKASSGREALSVIRNPNLPTINLIIADQRMPDITGVDLLIQTIPILPNAIRIILTGYTDINDIIDSINEAHIYKYLTKPIEPNDLLISVKRALEAYELRIENINLIEQLKKINENLEKKVEERTRQLQELIDTLNKQKNELEYLIEFKDKLVDELQLLSVTDKLTGISNRRRLEEFLETEWKRAVQENEEISLIMMDIDFFKLYNDFYGHAAGDKCLTQIAQIILQKLKRTSDLVARYGGEEFCCVLPDTNLDGAIKIAQEIRQAILENSILHENSPISNYITVSFGVHSMPPHENSWQELLEYADKFLYQAKNNGKDRIYCMRGEIR